MVVLIVVVIPAVAATSLVLVAWGVVETVVVNPAVVALAVVVTAVVTVVPEVFASLVPVAIVAGFGVFAGRWI